MTGYGMDVVKVIDPLVCVDIKHVRFDWGLNVQFGGKLGQTVGQLYDWQRNGIHGKPEAVHFDIYLSEWVFWVIADIACTGGKTS